MTEPRSDDQLLQILRDIHAAQLRSIELQHQAIALTTEHMAKTREISAESVKLQQLAVQRQRNSLRIVLPLAVLATVMALLSVIKLKLF